MQTSIRCNMAAANVIVTGAVLYQESLCFDNNKCFDSIKTVITDNSSLYTY